MNRKQILYLGVFLCGGVLMSCEDDMNVHIAPTSKGPGSLIIARGGKIMAEGTAQAPIVFTFERDPLDGSTRPTTRGRWGGLILLGKARLNSTPSETAIEGIPTDESRALYGGHEDTDDSGVLRYVSIRHGGMDIGAGNEINGLTLGGVGSGTQIEYVEVIGNKDDGIEWFGGTARAKHLISAYNADDALDYDEGYRGFNQFVLVHQDPAEGAADRGGEHDGGTSPETAQPYAIPLFVNLTSIGNSSSRAVTIRDNAGGRFYHSVFTGYNKGVDIEYVVNSEKDSWNHVRDGNLVFIDNVFFDIGDITEVADLFTLTTSNENAPPQRLTQALASTMQNNGNRIEDPQFASTSLQTTTSALFTTARDIDAQVLSGYAHHGYEDVNYIGAVAPTGTPWYAVDDWSFYSHIVKGVSDKVRSQGQEEEVFDDARMRSEMQAHGNHVRWTRDKTYVLNGHVFVQEGETLSIEAGTVIRGRSE